MMSFVINASKQHETVEQRESVGRDTSASCEWKMRLQLMCMCGMVVLLALFGWVSVEERQSSDPIWSITVHRYTRSQLRRVTHPARWGALRRGKRNGFLSGTMHVASGRNRIINPHNCHTLICHFACQLNSQINQLFRCPQCWQLDFFLVKFRSFQVSKECSPFCRGLRSFSRVLSVSLNFLRRPRPPLWKKPPFRRGAYKTFFLLLTES